MLGWVAIVFFSAVSGAQDAPGAPSPPPASQPLFGIFHQQTIHLPTSADAPPLQVGMEIEFTSKTIQPLVQFFDFGALQTKRPDLIGWLPLGFFDDYLATPSQLNDLSPELRAELVRGLNFEVTIDAGSKPLQLPSGRPADMAPDTGPSTGPVILGPDGKPVQRRIVIPGPVVGRPVSTPAPRPPTGVIAPDSARAQRDWQILQDRWRALTETQKRQYVRLDHLPIRKKAILATWSFGTLKSRADFNVASHLVLKSDAPEGVKEALHGMTWKHDGHGVLEFNHAVPLADVEEYVSSVRRFGAVSGVLLFLREPTRGDAQMEFSYHVHISRKGKDLEWLALALNDLRALRILDTGAELSDYGYQPDIRGKGLIRLVHSDHIELRNGTTGFESELREFLRWADLPREQAELEIKQEILGRLSPARLARLREQRPYLAYRMLKLSGVPFNVAEFAANPKVVYEILENGIFDVNLVHEAVRRGHVIAYLTLKGDQLGAAAQALMHGPDYAKPTWLFLLAQAKQSEVLRAWSQQWYSSDPSIREAAFDVMERLSANYRHMPVETLALRNEYIRAGLRSADMKFRRSAARVLAEHLSNSRGHTSLPSLRREILELSGLLDQREFQKAWDRRSKAWSDTELFAPLVIYYDSTDDPEVVRFLMNKLRSPPPGVTLPEYDRLRAENILMRLKMGPRQRAAGEEMAQSTSELMDAWKLLGLAAGPDGCAATIARRAAH